MLSRKREVSPEIVAREFLRLLGYLLEPKDMRWLSRERIAKLRIDVEVVLDQVVRNMDLADPRDRNRHGTLRREALSLVFDGATL